MDSDSKASALYRHATIGVLAVLSFFFLQIIMRQAGGWSPEATRGTTAGLLLDRLLYALLFCGLGWLWLSRILPWFFLLEAGLTDDAPASGSGRSRYLWGAAPGRALAVGLAGGCALLAGVWVYHQSFGATEPGLAPDRQRLSAALATREGWPVYFVLSGLVTPLLEEFFYRGLLTGFLRRQGLRAWFALALPALCFAAAHPLDVAPLLGTIGLLFGVLFWRWGLASAVVAHSTYNAGILLYTFFATPGPAG